MKWLRIVGLLILISYAAICTIVLAAPKHPIRLPLYFFHHNSSDGIFQLQGTWRLESHEMGFPIQSTALHCEKASARCLEVTVVVADNQFMMPFSIEERAIDRWDADGIVFGGKEGNCHEIVYNVAFATQAVTGLTRPDRNRSSVCDTANANHTDRRGSFVDPRK